MEDQIVKVIIIYVIFYNILFVIDSGNLVIFDQMMFAVVFDSVMLIHYPDSLHVVQYIQYFHYNVVA